MKLIKRYKQLSSPIKASLWFVACNVIQKATQIITTPIYTKILSQSQFGEYTVFLSWVEVVAVFTTLDIFYSGYNVGMERFREDRETYTTSMHGLCFFLTTAWSILLVPAASLISPYVKVSSLQIRLLFMYMYVFPIFQFWSARKKYDYQYKPLILVTSISSLGTIILGTVFAITFNNKSDGVIIAKILVEMIIAIPLLIVSINKVKNLFNSYYWKYALRFNIPLVPHYLSTMILNHSDRLMIVFFCGQAYAGIYSVAYSIAMLMTIIQNAVNSAIIPWMYRKLREKNFAGMTKVTTIVVGLMAILNLALLVIAPEAIRLISTREYMDAINVIPPVTFGVFLTAIYGLFVNVEFYFNFNKFAAMASGLAAALNIVLNYFFIQVFGYIAAGYTTFASYLLLTVVHYLGLRRVSVKNDLEIKKVFNVKYISTIVIVFALSSIGVYSAYNYPLIRYLFVLGLVIIAGFSYKRIIRFAKQLYKDASQRMG